MKFISSTSGKQELYDLSVDPNEERNLYREGDRASVELQTLLESWLGTLARHPPSRQTLDRETMDRLRSLGYVQ
jgi:hypothetical protein